MREFIGRAAEERPLLLVFEDLHWADESTLLLLEYLAPNLPEMPVMIVGTFRDDEVEPTSPLARILNQLVRERLVTRIPLRRLTEEVVASLVAGLTGQRPPAALVRGIYAQSEGNPFFTEEIYLHLAESGVLFDDQGRFRGDLRVEDLESPPASAWSSGSGWPDCPRPPSGPWSRRPCGAGCSSWTWSSGWPATPAGTCSTPSTRPSGRA
jgi:hypothetical protein